jgi:hypothetical protein
LFVLNSEKCLVKNDGNKIQQASSIFCQQNFGFDEGLEDKQGLQEYFRFTKN